MAPIVKVQGKGERTAKGLGQSSVGLGEPGSQDREEEAVLLTERLPEGTPDCPAASTPAGRPQHPQFWAQASLITEAAGPSPCGPPQSPAPSGARPTPGRAPTSAAEEPGRARRTWWGCWRRRGRRRCPGQAHSPACRSGLRASDRDRGPAPAAGGRREGGAGGGGTEAGRPSSSARGGAPLGTRGPEGGPRGALGASPLGPGSL